MAAAAAAADDVLACIKLLKQAPSENAQRFKEMEWGMAQRLWAHVFAGYEVNHPRNHDRAHAEWYLWLHFHWNDGSWVRGTRPQLGTEPERALLDDDWGAITIRRGLDDAYDCPYSQRESFFADQCRYTGSNRYQKQLCWKFVCQDYQRSLDANPLKPRHHPIWYESFWKWLPAVERAEYPLPRRTDAQLRCHIDRLGTQGTMYYTDWGGQQQWSMGKTEVVSLLHGDEQARLWNILIETEEFQAALLDQKKTNPKLVTKRDPMAYRLQRDMPWVSELYSKTSLGSWNDLPGNENFKEPYTCCPRLDTAAGALLKSLSWSIYKRGRAAEHKAARVSRKRRREGNVE